MSTIRNLYLCHLGSGESIFRLLYGTPKEEERTALLGEEDYAMAVKKIYDNRRLYLGYQFYPEVYPLYNDWITVAGNNEQPDKVIQLAKWAISIYQNDFSHYIMYLAMSEAYMDKDDVKTALKACDDARRAVGLLRETVDPRLMSMLWKRLIHG